MHICFVDESTTPPKPTKRIVQPYFVIAGVFIPVAQWREIRDEITKLKAHSDFKVRGEIKWRFFGTQNNDPKNSVRHLSGDARDAFRQKFFSIMSRRISVKAAVSVTAVSEAYKKSYINDEHDLYGYTYKPVTERFQYHLQEVSRLSGAIHCGIVVADHRGRNDDERMRRYHQKLVHSESSFTSKYDNLIEELFLSPSHTSTPHPRTHQL